MEGEARLVGEISNASDLPDAATSPMGHPPEVRSRAGAAWLAQARLG